MWHQLEPLHAVFYYAPEVSEEAAALGYDVSTRWPAYFAWRLAPLGAAGTRQAAAACYSFSPRMVAEHVPAAWSVASSARLLPFRGRVRPGRGSAQAGYGGEAGFDRPGGAVLGRRREQDEPAHASLGELGGQRGCHPATRRHADFQRAEPGGPREFEIVKLITIHDEAE